MKIRKILFIDLFKDYSSIDEAVGQGSISAVLRQAGYDTMLVAYKESKIKIEEIYAYKPDMIGFSVQPRTVFLVNEVSKKISALLPEAIQVIGGYLPTNCPNEILKCMEKIDIVIRGEGEYTTLKLIETINEEKSLYNVDGISFMDKGENIHNKDRMQIADLDALPFPDRDIVVKHGIHVARVEGARGCTSMCSFCSIHGFWSNNHKKDCQVWRGKSVKRFVDELEYLVKEYNINRFHFLDSSYENPYYNSERIMEIAKEIITRNLNITYYVNMRADFHKMASEELMSLLIESGLNSIFIGVESFNTEDLSLYAKTISVEDSVKTIEVLTRYSVQTDIGFINFHPYTSIKLLRNNAQYLYKYGFSSRLLLRNKLMVFKGTNIYEKMKKDQLFTSDFYEIKDYSFIDQKVSILNNYIENFIKQTNDSSNNVLIELDVYEHRHLSLVAHLKHFFNKSGDNAALNVVIAYEKQVSMLLSELNEIHTKWFMELLDLVDGDWSPVTADYIMNKYMNIKWLNELLSKFKHNSLVLYRNLTNMDKQYAKLL